MARKLEVSYAVTVEPEDIPFVGNCSAIDPETDRQTEEWIREQLNAGNEYAWCWVKVVASVVYDGIIFTGEDSLGGISCRDREELDRVFLPEMRAPALADLRDRLQRVISNERADLDAVKRHADRARVALARLPKKVRA